MMAEPQSLNEAVARVAASQRHLNAFVLSLAPESWERALEGPPGYEVTDAVRAMELRGLIETKWVDAASDAGHKLKMWRRAGGV